MFLVIYLNALRSKALFSSVKSITTFTRMMAASLLISSFSLSYASDVSNENTSEESSSTEADIARLTLKHVSYSHHLNDYLNAITDVLVAEQKGIWQHLPQSQLNEEDHSELSKSLKQNLTLIEASLYHYFGMEKEAEIRYKKATKSQNQSSHLPMAYLLLARYYYEQQNYAETLKWLSRVDETQLSEEELSFKYLYQMDALVHSGKLKEAQVLLATLDEHNWLPVASYNAERMSLRHQKVSVSDQLSAVESANDSWFSDDPDSLSPLLQELQTQRYLQAGMDAVDEQQWSVAIAFFRKVPSKSILTIEARRWLAWSLMNNEQWENASKIWRTLTTVPAYEAIDALIMSATTTEKLGDKQKALAWFEKGVGFYAAQVELLTDLRNKTAEGQWFNLIEASNTSFWAPSDIGIAKTESLFLWASELWQQETFQQLLADHRDLVQLDQLLKAKTDHIDTFDFMVENREQAYLKTLQKINDIDANQRLDQYGSQAKEYNRKLEAVSDYKDPYSIGTKQQLVDQALLDRIKANLEKLKSMQSYSKKHYAKKHKTSGYELRYQHLDGIMRWELNEAYPENFRNYQRSVKGLNEQLSESVTALDKMKASQKLAPARFEGFKGKIAKLEQRLAKVVAQSGKLKEALRAEAIEHLDRSLAKKQMVAQSYLEKSVLAAARIRDEIAYEITRADVAPNSTNGLTKGGNH